MGFRWSQRSVVLYRMRCSLEFQEYLQKERKRLSLTTVVSRFHHPQHGPGGICTLLPLLKCGVDFQNTFSTFIFAFPIQDTVWTEACSSKTLRTIPSTKSHHLIKSLLSFPRGFSNPPTCSYGFISTKYSKVRIFYICLFLIEGQLFYNIVLVSAIHQHESAIVYTRPLLPPEPPPHLPPI